ncbi:hypothetical protein JCGZ_07626 [Jatropha curcas]|uniref:SHSP domain-containing protein n=1 Tax=Jatropha curcas TaxID=180498 RepID=A0A067KP30_JATCU|nr:hypothetical protein JCGZ_07626 [Jatropha curcas]
MELALRNIGIDPSFVDLLHTILDVTDETEKSNHQPSRAYLRDAKAMAATPADAKELPNAFLFVLDMPGLKPDQIKVQVEDGNMLVVTGERKREKERDQGIKYIRMERRLDIDKISAAYKDGVLTVTVEKEPPSEPKKSKTVAVKVVRGR